MLNLNSQIKSKGLPLINYSGNEPAGLIDPRTGSLIGQKIYPLGGQPYPEDVAVGTSILIDPGSCLSGAGMTACPIRLINDGTVWRPDGEQIMYSSFGSYASPVLSVAAQSPANTEVSFFPVGTRPLIPHLLFYLGIGVRVNFVAQKDADAAATASTFRCRFGTSTGVTNNSILTQGFTGAAASQEMTFDRTLRITGLGEGGNGKFTTQSAAKLFTPATPTNDNSAGDFSLNFSAAADCYVFLNHAVNNTTSGAYLISFSISLVP